MKRRLILAVLLAAACSDPSSPDGANGNVTIATASAWQGGQITLKGLAAADSGGDYRIDGQIPAIVARGADSLVLQLPGDAAGRVSVTRDGKAIGHVDIAGVTAQTAMPFNPASNPFPWTLGGKAAVVMAEPAASGGGRIVRYDLATGAVSELFPGSSAYQLSWDGTRTPTPTADPSVYGFTRLHVDRLARYTLDLIRIPTGAVVDTFGIDFNPIRQLAIMSTGVMVRTGPHHTFTRQTPTGSYIYFPTSEGDEDPDFIVMSKNGSRATVPSYGSPFGLPVFDATGQLLYRVATATRPYTAAFSAGGDTLFIGNVGLSGQNIGQVMAVRTSDGAVLFTSELGMHVPQNMTVDPNGKWVYVTTYHDDRSADGPPAYLQVLDARTLNVRGRVPLGIDASHCSAQIVQDSEALYVVCGSQTGPSQVVKIARP